MKDIDLVKKVRGYAEAAKGNGYKVLTVPLCDLFPLIEQLDAAQRERNSLLASQEHEDSCLIDALASRDEWRLRAVTAEAELKRRDEQEPVATKLVYSSVLPKFIGDSDEVVSYSCFIHGNTPPRKTMEEAYADAMEMCGPLYAAAPAAVLAQDPVTQAVSDAVAERTAVAAQPECRHNWMAWRDSEMQCLNCGVRK